MITDKFVKGYAVLKSEWFNRDILDEYIPFVATIIIENNINEVDELFLTKKLNEKYNDIFQENFVRQILSQAVRKGVIINNRGKFVVDKTKVKQYAIKMDSFDFDVELLIDDFIKYANDNRYFPSKEEVKRLIFDFVDKYDDRVLYNNIEDISISNNVFLYHWCNYVIELTDNNRRLSEFFIGLCFGNLIKNALFYTSEATSSFSNLTIYLDTPMIFAVMGMDTPEREKSYKTLLTKAAKIGMSIRVFDHNFEEAKGIMERASRWAISSQYEQSKANKVAQFFYESGMSAEDIDEYIHDFEQQLNSNGIVKEETTYRTEENAFQADEKHLFDEIKQEYGTRSLKYNSEAEYDNSIQTDVRSLVMIQRQRAGAYSTDLNAARCVFITTNGVVAKVSKDYTLSNELTKDKIPTAITADMFGTLLWLNYPDKNGYVEQKLLADCKALLKASPQMIARFNLELDKAYKKKDSDLTEEKFLFLRSHPIVQTFLLDATSGDYTQFDTNTWRSVYDRIVASAQFDGEKKFSEEKLKHEKTKEELQQARDTIESKSENEKKLFDTIDRQQNAIKMQQNEFASIIATICAIAIYAVPYIVLSLIIVFVQSLFVNLTVKGICCGILTVTVGALLPIFFSKLKEKIKSKIIKKWQEKRNNISE